MCCDLYKGFFGKKPQHRHIWRKKKVEFTLFGPQVLGCCQCVAGLQINSTCLFDLQPNLAKSSCACSPIHLRVVFLVAKFHHLATKKKGASTFFKGVFGKQSLKFAMFRLQVLACCNYLVGFQKNLLLSLTCSQIWPCPRGGSPVHLPHKIEKNVFFFWKNFAFMTNRVRFF